MARHGIRVVAYMPGVVRTPLSQGIVDKNPLAVANTIALGRIAEPIEIAKVVVFLASDTAAYIDGTTIEISGGKLCVQNPIPLGKEV
ncbi:putative oxidoreductase [bioreactor metagenome]|uniref:Putative oxidoreductase n=1 Tax=bioreactor metagenome TaxID=1076179 RepID=A0A645CP27_9ZZZZ